MQIHISACQIIKRNVDASFVGKHVKYVFVYILLSCNKYSFAFVFGVKSCEHFFVNKRRDDDAFCANKIVFHRTHPKIIIKEVWEEVIIVKRGVNIKTLNTLQVVSKFKYQFLLPVTNVGFLNNRFDELY